jgi:hypothetical protein
MYPNLRGRYLNGALPTAHHDVDGSTSTLTKIRCKKGTCPHWFITGYISYNIQVYSPTGHFSNAFSVFEKGSS